MKAFVIQQPGNVEAVSFDTMPIQPDEALVRVAYAGLCATDLAILSGDMTLVRNGSIRYPVRFGHEWSGVIEKVGDQVTDFAPGDRVISESGVSCGKCEACKQKQYAKCEHGYSLGTINCWDGAFCDYMHMPVRHLYKVPESISLKEAALIEPTCIALSGVKKTMVGPDKTVLIIGTGAIGLASVALAKYYGARRIILCGRKDNKLEIGKQMGADICINTTREDMEEAVRRETNGKGADAVIETSGVVGLIPQVLRMTAYGGFVGLIGFYERTVPAFEIDEIVMKALSVRGIMGEFGMPGEVIGILATGKVDLKPMITHIFPFDETAQVMQNAASYGDTKIKMLAQIAGE